MPCEQVNLSSEEFVPQNKTLLGKAVAGLNWTMVEVGPNHYRVTDNYGYTTEIVNGKATGPNQSVNAIRNAYGDQVMDLAQSWAKTQGWRATRSSPNKLELKKGW